MVPYALLRDKSYGKPPGNEVANQPGNGENGLSIEGKAQ